MIVTQELITGEINRLKDDVVRERKRKGVYEKLSKCIYAKDIKYHEDNIADIKIKISHLKKDLKKVS